MRLETRGVIWLHNSASFCVFGFLTGLISIFLAVIIMVMPTVGIFTLTLILAVGLLISSIGRIIFVFRSKEVPRKIRASRFFVGLVAITLSLVLLLLPGIGTNILLILLAIGLFFQGNWRISIDWISKRATEGVRALYLGLGILTLVFSLMVIINPDLGVLPLVLLLAFVLLINRMGSVPSSFIGQKSINQV